jgi:salicylate hydroxylase
MVDVLRIYQDIRLPRGNMAAALSRDNGLMYEFNHPDFLLGQDPPKVELEKLGNAIGQSFEWLAEGGCDEVWNKAEEQLQKSE